MEAHELKQRFMARLPPGAGFALLDQLPDVFLFAKDRTRRFVLGNPALVRLFGCRREEEVIGRRDEDFSPAHLCERFAADDARVLAGHALVDQVELGRNPDATIAWYSTTKLPLRDHAGAVIGLVGITRDLQAMSSTSHRFLAMAPVIEAMMADYAKPLTMTGLARLLGLSVSQFGRSFRKRFGVTPLRYLIGVRIGAACELLTTTGLPLSTIALETGFYDQSHFSHQFVKRKGMTPSRYRGRYGGGGSGEQTVG
jgi:PAS domain S-box-containing protein